jgi:hypothetical protein
MAVQYIETLNQEGVITGYKGVSGSTNRTICFWFKGSFLHQSQVFGWGTEASGQRFVLEWEAFGGNNIFILTFGRYKGWLPGNLGDGNWHWVCITLNGTTNNDLDMYVDDSLLAPAGVNSGAINTGTTNDVVIGSGIVPFLKNSNSDIYQFRIYDRALSALEQTTIFNSFGNEQDGITSGLQVNLLFGAETGTFTNEIDLSPNGRNAVGVNSPQYIVDPFSTSVYIPGTNFNNGFNNGIMEGVA